MDVLNFNQFSFRLTLQQIAIACSILLVSLLIIIFDPFHSPSPQGVVTQQFTKEQVQASENLRESWNQGLEYYYRVDRTASPKDKDMGLHQKAVLKVSSSMKNRIADAVDDPESPLYRVNETTALLGSASNAEELVNTGIAGGTQAVLTYIDRDGVKREIAISDEELILLGSAKQQAAMAAIALPVEPKARVADAWLQQIRLNRQTSQALRDHKRSIGRDDLAQAIHLYIDPIGGIH